MKNKWLLIGIAVAVVVIGIFAAMSARGTNDQPNVPAVSTVTPTNPAPVPTVTPATEPSSGVIEITGEQLVKDLLANPKKYKKGDVLRISGTITTKTPEGFSMGHTYLYYYSPRGSDNPSESYSFTVVLDGTFSHAATQHNAKVTVLGTFTQWSRAPEGGSGNNRGHLGHTGEVTTSRKGSLFKRDSLSLCFKVSTTLFYFTNHLDK